MTQTAHTAVVVDEVERIVSLDLSHIHLIEEILHAAVVISRPRLIRSIEVDDFTVVAVPEFLVVVVIQEDTPRLNPLQLIQPWKITFNRILSPRLKINIQIFPLIKFASKLKFKFNQYESFMIGKRNLKF